jgi:alpha-mannosidase
MEYPGDESSQSIGEFNYRYALIPHDGLWEQAGLYNEALAFSAPMHVCQFGKQEGILPLQKSFVSIDGSNIILSSMKRAEERDSIIIRMYNPSEEDSKGKLEIGFDFEEAYMVNLNEERIEGLTVSESIIDFKADHGKIVSIELVF